MQRRRIKKRNSFFIKVSLCFSKKNDIFEGTNDCFIKILNLNTMRYALKTVIGAGILLGVVTGCYNTPQNTDSMEPEQDSIALPPPEVAEESVVEIIPPLLPEDILLTKEFLYDKYTLEDVYPYQDTTRSFKWDAIRHSLAFVENVQQNPTRWVVMQNYKNQNQYPPLVKKYKYNKARLVSDTLGVSRYQSVPLYAPEDTITPELYGPDGSIAAYLGEEGSFVRVKPLLIEKEWMVPKRYLYELADSVFFSHVIVVDRKDQNITTLEFVERGKWKIRSMNPATTGKHNPPYGQETPLGIFVLQQKKRNMYFWKDGTREIGGYAPYASRFTNGAHIHGVPVNKPATKQIEYSWSLGTTPRSHMCVRNATSHAQFIYDWAPTWSTLVIVIE